ncbi:hypothetical protein FHG87_022524 [Trinorchestia longiramus]|nr:hypothetical protein FHG87_022524 [Trinorchestia longiramus]
MSERCQSDDDDNHNDDDDDDDDDDGDDKSWDIEVDRDQSDNIKEGQRRALIEQRGQRGYEMVGRRYLSQACAVPQSSLCSTSVKPVLYLSQACAVLQLTVKTQQLGITLITAQYSSEHIQYSSSPARAHQVDFYHQLGRLVSESA